MRYIVHLSTPQLNAVGAGESALPSISIGHNGRVAFGLTIFSIDQEDLQVYQANPMEYKSRGQWEKFVLAREAIAVKGAKPVDAELRFTRHGPVIHVQAAKNGATSVESP